MKPFRIVFVLITLFAINCHAKNLQAIFSYSKFNVVNKVPYVETYLAVAGSSVNYIKLQTAGYQSVITINIQFKDTAGKEFYNDTYNLNSPVIKDTNSTAFNFIDQQRIPLPNGKYILSLSITDKHGTGKTSTTSDTLLINFDSKQIALSDITFLDSYMKTETDNIFSKSGYDLIPYVDNFYPKIINSLKFYAEIYNTNVVLGDSTPYLLTYYIMNEDSKKILTNFYVSKKQIADPITVLLSEFNINNLTSGNYKMVIELRNKNNELFGYSDRFFQRSNTVIVAEETGFQNINTDNTFISSITEPDTLADYIACLRPISNASQTTWQDNQLKGANVKLMQQFFFNFWYSKNPQDPNQSWQEYKMQVKAVDRHYGDKFTKGYTTERGRVYLQYGVPNSVNRNEHEPDAYPYEVWHYYKLRNQSNIKFVFYNPNLAGNDYRLLHSDANGELHNPNWNIELYKRNTNDNDFDNVKREQNFGNHSQETFDNPK